MFFSKILLFVSPITERDVFSFATITKRKSISFYYWVTLAI